MKRTIRLLSLLLAVVMLLCVPVAAEEALSPRQQDLNTLYDTLQENHPDIFANTPEADFLSLKEEIQGRIDTESDFDFALDCASLAALVRDSHTNVSLGMNIGTTHFWFFDMACYGGVWTLTGIDKDNETLLGAQVKSINGLSMEQVLERFGTFLSADNSEKLRRSFGQMCYVAEPYFYLDIAEEGKPLSLGVEDSKGVSHTLTVDMGTLEEYREIALIFDEIKAQPVTARDNSQYYWGKALSPSAYYIQYNQCFEDPNLTMKDFAAQTEEALNKGQYSLILLDLRYNGGGSDGYFFPLLQVLLAQRDKGVQVAALIGSSTFSSAIINAVELQEAGFPLAGETTSGSVDHFGAVQSFSLENTGLTLNISSKFISLADYFDAAAGKGVETLVPDVGIAQTLADELAGRDTCVEAILADPSILQLAERPEAPLTRGRFIGQIYGIFHDPVGMAKELPFDDLLGFEWYAAALEWAAEQKIANGIGDGIFRSSRGITWQEASVFLVRTLQAAGVEMKAQTSAPLPANLATAPWNQEMVTLAWQWGLLPADADFSLSPTRTQGKAMIQQLASALRGNTTSLG